MKSQIEIDKSLAAEQNFQVGFFSSKPSIFSEPLEISY